MWLVWIRRFNPPSIDEFRAGIERGEDTAATAYSLTELIEQHGNRGWVDPLVEDLGPRVVLQVQDLANFLEVLTKYVYLSGGLGNDQTHFS